MLSDFKFGSSEDTYDYTKTPYIDFSFAFGLGDAPQELLSSTIKIVLGVGLGVPVFVFIACTLYIIIKKYRVKDNYQVFVEHD